VRALAESQASLVRDQTELAPALLALGQSKLESWIQSESLETALRVQEQAGQLHVIGVAPNAQARSSWEQRLRSIFAGARLEITTLQNPDQTLYFRVALLELKKRAFQTLGLQWPSQLHSQLGHAALQAPLDLQLQALEREGAARVLSQPELVVRVPGEAELFSGGEIPIEMRTIRGPQVDWKAYGLSLKLKALELAGEQVRLEISSEVSDLDRANGTANIPALQASRLKTQVDARIGKPLLLSGLFQRRSSKSGEGIPFLQKIPVAGLLFGAQSKTEEHSELVAMLLPLRSPPEPKPQISADSNRPPPISSPPTRHQLHSERDYMTPGLARER
jgi:hypothetical protein